jgi:hypothetical protein
MIKAVPLLTARQSSDVRGRLEEVRSLWIERYPAHPGEAYTLGVAAYLDAKDERIRAGDYFGRIERLNRVLRRHFADVFAAIRGSLQEQFGARFTYTTKLAAPGFHIFFGPILRRMQDLAPHFDIQYRNMPQTAGADPRLALSFTLPIALPRCGGGLDYWAIDGGKFERDLSGGRIKSAADYPSLLPPRYFPYEIGKLVVQNGVFLHRIAGSPGIVDSDERITLQGHAIKRGSTYVLYW